MRRKKESTMTSHLAFDHIIIAVRDLEAALADYQALGFAAYYGGKHTHKATHNALIALADGSYIELLAPVDPDDVDASVELLEAGEGFAGYALLSPDLAADAVRLAESGPAFTGPHAGHRARYDGERVAWQTINFDDQPRSPFLIADETPHELRVENAPDKIDHANGIVATGQVVIAVQDLDAARERYTAILGEGPTTGASTFAPIRDAHALHFVLANCTLTLAAPADAASPLVAHLAGRSERPYMLRLHTTRARAAGLLDVDQSHGARLALYE